MSAIVIEPHYLPCLEYVDAIRNFDKLILEKHEHYIKQTYRNRCYINTAHGVQKLVVPLTGRHGKVAFKDIRIDSGTKWRNNHWRTIQSAYARSPFFEHYAGDLNKVLSSQFEFLFDLNVALLSLCLGSVGMTKEVSETVSYEIKVAGDVFDLRSQINIRKEGSEPSAFHPQPYHQVFGNAFAGNLSIIDLLFCEGPDSLGILRAGRQELNK